MKKYFALIILIFFTFAADAAAQRAQKDSLASINGKIYDGSAEDLGSATFHPNIQLVTFDGEKADTSYTAAYHGVFSFRNIRPQRVYLKVFCVGRKTIEGYYELEAGRNAFFFTMEDAPQQIEESKVTAEVPLMKQIADTTIYNAAAVRTMDGESLRAILEQLPGFKVSKNKITVDGEEIKRTYINGVLVFGDNPLTAVGALKADEVSQVRVYDEQNAVDKRRGLKHSKKDRVLDVVTKEPLLRLAEAGILGEGGADETGQLRYSGAAALAYYSEMLQVNGFAGADNVGTLITGNGNPLSQGSVNNTLDASRALTGCPSRGRRFSPRASPSSWGAGPSSAPSFWSSWAAAGRAWRSSPPGWACSLSAWARSCCWQTRWACCGKSSAVPGERPPPGWACWPIPCRYTSTSPATPTWP